MTSFDKALSLRFSIVMPNRLDEEDEAEEDKL